LYRRLGELQSWAATRFGRNSQPVLGIEFRRMVYKGFSGKECVSEYLF